VCDEGVDEEHGDGDDLLLQLAALVEEGQAGTWLRYTASAHVTVQAVHVAVHVAV
jgi:hypothetical protein